MGCSLRAVGVSFDPDRFLSDSSLTAYKVWRRGEPKLSIVQGDAVHDKSGMNIIVSDAGLRDFDRQVGDAVEFLVRNRSELTRLIAFAGVEELGLDFGTAWAEDSVMQTRHIPRELILLAGQLGLDIEVSIYAVSAQE